MDAPQLTIVIPVRDRRHLIGRVLDCVAKALECYDFEVVVVDNGSTDGTPEVVGEWIASLGAAKSRARLLHEPRPGASAARNRGLAAVTTPFVMFFDSDDLFRPSLIGLIISEIGRGGCDILRWEVAIESGSLSPTPRRLTLLHHLYHASLATQRYCVATALMRRVGAWNESLPVWNDLEAGVRLLLAAPCVRLIGDGPQVTVIPQSESITGVSFAPRWRERAKSLDAIERSLREAGRADMAAHVEARRMILAATIAREGCADGAAELRSAVEARNGGFRRLVLKAVYGVQRLAGRGGTLIARTLL